MCEEEGPPGRQSPRVRRPSLSPPPSPRCRRPTTTTVAAAAAITGRLTGRRRGRRRRRTRRPPSTTRVATIGERARDGAIRGLPNVFLFHYQDRQRFACKTIPTQRSNYILQKERHSHQSTSIYQNDLGLETKTWPRRSTYHHHSSQVQRVLFSLANAFSNGSILVS